MTDQVILRRQLGSSIGYQRRNLKLSLDGRYIDTEYSIENRQQIQKSIGLTANLEVGARTSLYSRIQFSQINNTIDEGERDTDSSMYSIGMRNSLSRSLSVGADIRYLDNENTNGIGRDVFDFNETRISLNMTYNFQTNRQ